MRLIAIDPGRNPAFALFNGKELVSCGTEIEFFLVDRVVVERPTVYPHSPVPPNDVVALAITAGTLAAMFRHRGDGVEWVEPREWKGQVPKPKSGKWTDYIVHARVEAALSDEERTVYRGVLAEVPAKSCDLTDAVGLGLWARGRFV